MVLPIVGAGMYALHFPGRCYSTNSKDCIMKTSPCNEDPITPHFYTVKLGFTGVYIFSYFCSKTLIVGTH